MLLENLLLSGPLVDGGHPDHVDNGPDEEERRRVDLLVAGQTSDDGSTHRGVNINHITPAVPYISALHFTPDIWTLHLMLLL